MMQSTLLYASETWAVSKEMANRITAFEMWICTEECCVCHMWTGKQMKKFLKWFQKKTSSKQNQKQEMQIFWTHHKNRKITTTNFGGQRSRDKKKGKTTTKMDHKYKGMGMDAIQGVCEDVTGPRPSADLLAGDGT